MEALNFLLHFHFIRPYCLLLIILAIIIYVFLLKLEKRSHNWSKVLPQHFLQHLLINHQEQKQAKLPKHLLLLLWLIGCIALAGPTWQKLPVPLIKSEQNRVILLDLSLSMRSTDLKPDRLARAKLKIRDLLALQSDISHALVAYAGDAHVVTPLTFDHKTITSLLSALNPEMMPKPGSQASLAVEKAIALLDNTKSQRGEIIIFTDDIAKKETSKIKHLLANTHYHLSILGVGTKRGAPIKQIGGGFLKHQGQVVIPKLDEKSLASLASHTKGFYRRISHQENDLKALISEKIDMDNLAQDDENTLLLPRHWLNYIEQIYRYLY